MFLFENYVECKSPLRKGKEKPSLAFFGTHYVIGVLYFLLV